MKIYYHNINWIPHDFSKLNSDINNLDESFDVIILAESRNLKFELHSDKYVVAANTITVLVLVKKTIPYKIVDTGEDSISFKLHLYDQEFNCHAAYWSGKLGQERFSALFDRLNTFFTQNPNNFILIGDLNLKYTYYDNGVLKHPYRLNVWVQKYVDTFSRFVLDNKLKQFNRVPNKKVNIAYTPYIWYT